MKVSVQAVEGGEFFHLLGFFMQKDLIGFFMPEKIIFIRSVVNGPDQVERF